MRMSDSIEAIASALSAAQGEIDDATKKGLNPAFRSKYADMAAVRAVIREPLAKHGIAVTQFAKTVQHGQGMAVEVETMILHKTGQFMAETLRMPVVKQDAHGIGSAITYARRYGLMSMLALASEDDDGNAASNVGGTPAKQKAPDVDAAPILKAATEAAGKGIDTLRTYYKSLSPEQRDAIDADSLKDLTTLAKSVNPSEEA